MRHTPRPTTYDAGRPFIVAGQLRTAGPVGSASWCEPDPRGYGRGMGLRVAPPLRQAIAEHYARLGLMEHASVASFARFVLQLLAVGAPPQMVLEAEAALADEVRHAQACFSIARALGGHALSPGPLPVEDALAGPVDLLSVTRATIREGCVGETLAAMEVEEAATWVRDAQLASTLASIAEDELSHARLAWRFVAWAVRRVDAVTREQMGQFLWDAIADARGAAIDGPPTRFDPVVLRAWGVLSAEDRKSVRRRALETMVEPSAAALVADEAGVFADPRRV